MKRDFRERRWFFLARTIGGTTVEELKQRMTELEFRKWCVYYTLEPFGDDWDQTAMQLALYANSKSDKRYHPDDFIPYRNGEDKRKERLVELKEKFAQLKQEEQSRINA